MPAILTAGACAADCNSLILAQIQTMPRGGRYAASRIASARLQAAIHGEGLALSVTADGAQPSYCSGATYLVFLKTVQALQRRGDAGLTAPALAALPVRGQRDGAGVWGRWNANGPGTARLFHELGLGHSFDNFDQARPGDFMKIFWSAEVGRYEHGHSVVFLGRETVGDEERVRFWSSNMPDGYGEKSVPRRKIAYAVFSRLERPEALANVAALATVDDWLAGMAAKRSSVAEVRKMTGMR